MIRVALIHDWLTGMRGGEYVLEAIAELFTDVEVFTLVETPEKISPKLRSLKRHTSLLQKLPGARTHYRHYLPLMPFFIEQFDLSGFDLIISSSHCVAKGIRKPKNSIHISYVHAPMRYIWDRYDEYFGPGKASWITRLAAKTVRTPLQKWDYQVSQAARVDHLIANSRFIAEKISSTYQRSAEVIYPFADLSRFTLERTPENFYLMVGAFAPYKRTDLAIEVFNNLKLPLKIIGSGQDERKLKKIAGPTIEFLGSLSNEAIAHYYSQCKAFIFPGVEDFGITPIEAMASGAPVIALDQGGAAESVNSTSGVLFFPQKQEALAEAILKIESNQIMIPSQNCRRRASEFTKNQFQENLKHSILSFWEASGKDPSRIPFATIR